jgi:hypothetical protein
VRATVCLFAIAVNAACATLGIKQLDHHEMFPLCESYRQLRMGQDASMATRAGLSFDSADSTTQTPNWTVYTWTNGPISSPTGYGYVVPPSSMSVGVSEGRIVALSQDNVCGAEPISPENSRRFPIPVQTQESLRGTSAVLTSRCNDPWGA